jgi:dTDP-4-amino-4,6-dideoxygalactose transaminase
MLPAGLAGIAALTRERGGVLVEDAAQALGSVGPLGAAGSVGSAGATSFYPTKIITAAEGGVLSTADDDLVRHAKVLRDQGKISFAENVHVAEGYSWRLSELHAVVGTTHLALLDEVVESKRRIAARYDELLAGTPLRVIAEPVGHRWNRYKYVALLPDCVDREDVRRGLAEHGVGLSGEVFARPLHAHPVFADRFGGVRVPHAERFCAQHICLPISPDLSETDVAHVAASLIDVTTDLLPAG